MSISKSFDRVWASPPMALADVETQVGFTPKTLSGKTPHAAYVVAANYVVVLYEGPREGELTEVRTRKDADGSLHSETVTFKGRVK